MLEEAKNTINEKSTPIDENYIRMLKEYFGRKDICDFCVSITDASAVNNALGILEKLMKAELVGPVLDL